MKKLLVLATLLFFTTLACGLGSSPATEEAPEPAAQPTNQPEASAKRCGDGVCDGPENPANCPADCAAPPTGEPTQPAPPPLPTKAGPPPTTPVPPSDEAAPPPPAKDPNKACGDGVCDQMEQNNPQLCPQDCESQPAADAPAVLQEGDSFAPAPETAPATEVELVSLPDGELAVAGDPESINQEGGAAGVRSQPNIAFILDGSGSMNANLPGCNRSKLAVAKEVLTGLVGQVPAEVNGALWIYGHRYPQEPKEQSCRDIEQVFPMGAVDAAGYSQAIQGITAIGYTPIADSLTLAAQNLPTGEDQVNSIILVSDGEETCGGDPCALAAALKQSEANVTIHVVGYDVDEQTREQLQCIAEVSGGMYRDASSAELLQEALAGALEVAQSDTLLRLEVVGPGDTQVDAAMRLYQTGTDSLVAEMGAWGDNTVAPGTYDITVDTTPPVLFAGITIPEGSSTLIRMEVGAFELVGIEGDPANPYSVEVVDPASGEPLAGLADPAPDPYYVLPGVYNLELYPSLGHSSPEAVFSRVAINALETVRLQLGALDLQGIGGEAVRPHGITFYDAASGREVADFSGYSPDLYFLAPGVYMVELYFGISAYPRGVLQDLTISPGEINTVELGAYVFRDVKRATGQPGSQSLSRRQRRASWLFLRLFARSLSLPPRNLQHRI